RRADAILSTGDLCSATRGARGGVRGRGPAPPSPAAPHAQERLHARPHLRRLGRALAARTARGQRARIALSRTGPVAPAGRLLAQGVLERGTPAGMADRVAAVRRLAIAPLGLGGAAQRRIPARVAAGLVARCPRARRTGDPLKERSCSSDARGSWSGSATR